MMGQITVSENLWGTLLNDRQLDSAQIYHRNCTGLINSLKADSVLPAIVVSCTEIHSDAWIHVPWKSIVFVWYVGLIHCIVKTVVSVFSGQGYHIAVDVSNDQSDILKRRFLLPPFEPAGDLILRTRHRVSGLI